MRWEILIAILSLIVQQSVAPPVQNPEEPPPNDPNSAVDIIEYHKYLREVIDLLESDPDFREKLQKANESDIKSGNIAEHLSLVSHQVRTKLDEIKRIELLRLKKTVERQLELENEISPDHKDHINHQNPHTFEIEDLKKLIIKTTHDLHVLDAQRKEEYKNYEMNKQYNEDEHLKEIKDDNERKKYVAEHEKEKEKQKKHPALHTPGSKKQLEEVWEEQDGLKDQTFNPEIFFQMHDTDGNGLWDQDEVKVLFQKDVEKLNIDSYEKIEEMERMRENLFTHADINEDGVIDHREYMKLVNSPQFQQDSGWTPMSEQEVYTQEEYEKFRQQRMLELQHEMAYQQQQQQVHDNLSPPVYAQNVGGMPHQVPVQQQQYHGQVPMQQQPQHPQDPAFQQQYHQPPPPAPAHPQQQYQPQGHPQQQQQYQPQGHQQQHYQPQGNPQQQYQPQGQQQQYHVPRDQIPPEHQYHGEPVQPKAPVNLNSQAPQQQINGQMPQVPVEVPLNSVNAGVHPGNQALPVVNKVQ